MPSSVPAVKAGLRQYLASWSGLRPGDGVTVRSAPGLDLPDDTVELGETTATQTQAGLASRAEQCRMTCWVQATRPGTDEAAIAAARTRAYGLAALVEQAFKADPGAGGTVPPPGQVAIGDSTLIEAPADTDGSGSRRAQVRFSVTWTSHIT
jgi:hypothetical protein